MSANRRTIGNEPGIDCPVELTFEEFLNSCRTWPIWRVQGRVSAYGPKLVRFNRAVRVMTETARTVGPAVDAMRVRWNPILGTYQDTGETMTLPWRTLDWVTPQASNDPNGTWAKVTHIGDLS